MKSDKTITKNFKVIDVSSKYNRYVTKFWSALNEQLVNENSLKCFANEIDKATIQSENRHRNRVRLFQVFGACSESVRMIQVEKMASSLNSEAVFVLETESKVIKANRSNFIKPFAKFWIFKYFQLIL